MRHPKTYGGEQTHLLIPVCKCQNQRCLFKYTRVLPEDLTPHKHYKNEVIEDAVDEVVDSNTLETENLPCEQTMENWKAWFAGNEHHIDGVLKSLGSRVNEFGLELLNSFDSLISKLRDNGAGWLAVVNLYTWNFNVPPLNLRQLSLTDFNFVPEAMSLLCPCKEEDGHEGQGSP